MQLLNLPGVGLTYDLNDKINRFRSSASAPPILQSYVATKGEIFLDDDKSIKSARSAASSESDQSSRGSSCRRKGPKKQSGPSEGTKKVDLGTAQDFHENWLESKRKALEDIEEGSVEDVFQVDVDRNKAVDDTQSRTSASSTISSWLQSIRVVPSASETQSSQEHSSIAQSSSKSSSNSHKENNSTDSLEHSLAPSLVEPHLVEV